MKWGNSSLYASTGALLGLKAIFPDGTYEIIEENVAVNSPAGSIPIKYEFTGETIYNSKTEFASLEKQATELRPYQVPGTDLIVEFYGIPCLADSKSKVWWSNRVHMGSCYVCKGKIFFFIMLSV